MLAGKCGFWALKVCHRRRRTTRSLHGDGRGPDRDAAPPGGVRPSGRPLRPRATREARPRPRARARASLATRSRRRGAPRALRKLHVLTLTHAGGVLRRRVDPQDDAESTPSRPRLEPTSPWNRPRIDPESTPTPSRMDPGSTSDRPRIHAEADSRRPRTDPELAPVRPRIDPESTLIPPHMIDPELARSRPRIDPNPHSEQPEDATHRDLEATTDRHRITTCGNPTIQVPAAPGGCRGGSRPGSSIFSPPRGSSSGLSKRGRQEAAAPDDPS